MHIKRDFANMTPAECAAQLVRVMDDDGIRIFTDNPVSYVLGIKEDRSDYVTGTTYMAPHLLITESVGSGKTSFINTVIPQHDPQVQDAGGSYIDSVGEKHVITGIGMLSFAYNDGIKSVIIPPEIDIICMDAF